MTLLGTLTGNTDYSTEKVNNFSTPIIARYIKFRPLGYGGSYPVLRVEAYGHDTLAPTLVPTPIPTPDPIPDPTHVPTAVPTRDPTALPTPSPTTVSPTTSLPTTSAPSPHQTTSNPTTQNPTTTTTAPSASSTTSIGSTDEKNGAAPTTSSPTTSSPTTAAPTTAAPTTASPTPSPTTASPTTSQPTTSAPSPHPTTSNPTTQNPTTSAPTITTLTTSASASSTTLSGSTDVKEWIIEFTLSLRNMVGLANIGQDAELIAFILEVTKEAISIQFSDANAEGDAVVDEEFDILMKDEPGENGGAIDLYLEASTKDESVSNRIESVLQDNYGDIDTELIAFILQVTKEAIVVQFDNVNGADGTVVDFDIFLISGIEQQTNMNDAAIHLYLEAATNDESISTKIEDALEHNYGDIVAFIVQRLRAYFADSNNGYDGVDADNLTVEISDIGTGGEDDASNTPASGGFIDLLTSYWLYLCIAGAVLLLCCGALILVCICKKKEKKAVNELELPRVQSTSTLCWRCLVALLWSFNPSSVCKKKKEKAANELEVPRVQSTSTLEALSASGECEIAEIVPASMISGKSIHPSHVSSDNNIIKGGVLRKTGSEDSDSEDEAQNIQQAIQAQQQQWIQYQVQRQQNIELAKTGNRAIQRMNSGDSDESDHEAQKIQQAIQAQQQQWIQYQVQRQQNIPANGVPNMMMNPNVNMSPNMNMMMQMQMQQQHLQMQQQYMQQQYANNMPANQQQPVLLDELPEAPSEVQLPDHCTAGLSLDPNGVNKLLDVDERGEMMNPNVNMSPNMNMMMQMQMQQQHLQMQQQYMQQQYAANNMMVQPPPAWPPSGNNAPENPQQPVFVDELPNAPSEIQLADHYTARLSLDPNGIHELLDVDERGEQDAYVEGADMTDEDLADAGGDDDIYGQMK
eukprot:CAMPEP_0197078040 /NCGR_PEP_ID=MMETSP1384-20130603/212921_1 /TAXON_ID=29189 /ORGANISM="Ammonia sp." /LENGTH=916 /DNA_ID=CAMNT_0042516905 /DNA_START=80 /DNA_END=2833 /DNA_ORIENTATION=-